jgi:predicted amidophosphoribosyltransferase
MPDKICQRCQEDWPNDQEFYRSDTTPWCIACEKEAGKKGDAKRWRSPEAWARKREQDKVRWAQKKRERMKNEP